MSENETETIICLACGLEQPYPKHIGWCINCFSHHLGWYGGSIESGTVYLVLPPDQKEQLGIDLLSGLSTYHKRYRLEEEEPEDERYEVVHKFQSDNYLLSIWLLLDALPSKHLLLCLSQDEVNHIKTITKFENGKFYFQQEGRN